MGFNGSGTFTINSSGNPVEEGSDIDPDVHNTTLTEIATGLSSCLTRDGQSTVTQNTPWNSKKITLLGNGDALTDAATIGNVITGTASYQPTVTGTVNAIVITPSLHQRAALVEGLEIWFISSGANTGAVTLNYSGLGAKSVTKFGSTALASGDIRAGAMVGVKYDGTRFQMISPI